MCICIYVHTPRITVIIVVNLAHNPSDCYDIRVQPSLSIELAGRRCRVVVDKRARWVSLTKLLAS